MGYLQRARPLQKPRFAAHNGSCGSRLQARSRTKGKPNYLLQEARNEEALARLDMNLWCTCGRAGCTGTLGVRFMGENWGGNVRPSQFPARGHKSPSYTCHNPHLCQSQPVKAAKLFSLISDFMQVKKQCQPHIIDISCEPDHILHSHRPFSRQLSIVQGCHEKTEKLCTILKVRKTVRV